MLEAVVGLGDCVGVDSGVGDVVGSVAVDEDPDVALVLDLLLLLLLFHVVRGAGVVSLHMLGVVNLGHVLGEVCAAFAGVEAAVAGLSVVEGIGDVGELTEVMSVHAADLIPPFPVVFVQSGGPFHAVRVIVVKLEDEEVDGEAVVE